MRSGSKKLISNGLQFFVYRIDNYRALKTPTTRSQKKSILKQWAKNDSRLLNRLQKDIVRAERKTDTSIKGLKKIIERIDAAILGNPKFLKHPSYEQDIVVPLENYFAKHIFTENKVMVNEYIKNILQTWQFGFSDTVFNFTINNGVKNGEVILLDLGELSFSKTKVKALIIKKEWLKHWSYLNMRDGKLKSYIKRTMNVNLTLKALEKNWKIKLTK